MQLKTQLSPNRVKDKLTEAIYSPPTISSKHFRDSIQVTVVQTGREAKDPARQVYSPVNRRSKTLQEQLDSLKSQNLPLDKSSLKVAPDNGFFQYYLQKASSKRYGGGSRSNQNSGQLTHQGMTHEGRKHTPTSKVLLKSAEPQFQFWSKARMQIQRFKPKLQGQQERVWRSNSRSHSRSQSRLHSASASGQRFMAQIDSQVTDIQYANYLAKVAILNQKKEFLDQFRAQLPADKLHAVMQQIKAEAAEVQKLEDELFRPTPSPAKQPQAMASSTNPLPFY